jgi:hypothetical protein
VKNARGATRDSPTGRGDAGIFLSVGSCRSLAVFNGQTQKDSTIKKQCDQERAPDRNNQLAR